MTESNIMGLVTASGRQNGYEPDRQGVLSVTQFTDSFRRSTLSCYLERSAARRCRQSEVENTSRLTTMPLGSPPARNC
jgi:hypothetical protein